MSKNPPQAGQEVEEKVSSYTGFLLVAIIAIAQVSRAILVSDGMNSQLALVVYTLFFLWPAYLSQVKARGHDLPVKLLQSTRATAYGLSLLVLIPSNAILVTAANPSTIFLTPIVGFGLAAVLAVSLKRAYQESRYFTGQELHEYSSMIANAGTACNWVSIAVGYSNLLLAYGVLNTAVGIGGVAAAVIVDGGVSYWSEWKSSKNMRKLLGMVRQSGWAGKVEKAHKIAEQRERRLGKK